MRKHYFAFLVLLVPVFLVLNGRTVIVEAQKGAAVVNGKRWSDPATWPDKKVPGKDAAVTIAKDMDVVLDVSPPALRSLTIDGKLSFANSSDLELTTEWIMLHGELQIGSETAPHTRKATITLTNTVPGEDVMAMGDRGIMLMGGTLNLHGDRQNTWTKLANTAPAGSTSIQVLNAAGWRVGDEIVLASTDYDPRQAERRNISAISGNTITLDKKLDYMHFGKITFDVDERGEVGLLTRNIRIQASADAEQSYLGGHVMAMVTSKMFVEGVEFNRMGQNLTLARYPIHWHLVGEGQGQYIRNSAIHDTYNRCVTVHGTNNLQVENNVTYNSVGHCFFLEDGVETGNQFVHNLGIQTKCHTTKPCVPTNLAASGSPKAGGNGQQSKDVLIPSDNTVSMFWITNPDNVYRENVAAGSDQIGFWFATPVHPTGAFEGSEASAKTWPRRTRPREFKGNVGHSNFDSFMFDRNPAANGTFSVAGGNAHTAKENPADGNSKTVESLIDSFTSYKNRNGGVWSRGEMKVFKNLKVADSAIGYTHASGSLGRDIFTSRVTESLFVGETENIGNPRTPEEIAYGRSLPKPEMPDYPIRGYEYYDLRHDVDNVTFVNFQDNATRKTGAISYLMYTSFGVSNENSIEKAKFVNAKPVYFPPSTERKWASDTGGSGYNRAGFHDKDGSVGGVPDSYIFVNSGAAAAAANDNCRIEETWGARVCKGDSVRQNAGGGRGGAPGAAAGRGGPGAGGPGAGFGAPGGAGGPGAGRGGPGGAGGFGGGRGGPGGARGGAPGGAPGAGGVPGGNN